MRKFLNLSLLLAVSATALATGACGVDYSNLGSRPVDEGGSAGAGDGTGAGDAGGGGASPGTLCTEPNPAGCGESNPCPSGSLCVETDPQGCAPSRCDCGESGYWACTKDCVTPHACVAAAPAIAIVSCGLIYQPGLNLQINLTERSCSAEAAYPHLEVGVDLRNSPDPAGQVFELPANDPVLFGTYVKGTGASDRVEVVSGSLSVTSWHNTKGATGRYEFLLTDGARVSGYFDATVCPSNIACVASAIERDLSNAAPSGGPPDERGPRAAGPTIRAG